MSLRIETCQDADTWRETGRKANADRPQYAEGNVLWPAAGEPVNSRTAQSLIALADGHPVGRLQRRGEHVLEIAVVPALRRRGIGRALVQFAGHGARRQGLTALRADEIDEEGNGGMLAFLEALGFERQPAFSMRAELEHPIPERALEAEARWRTQGFRPRLLPGADEASVQLTAELQARYFPAFPQFMPPNAMVRILLATGMFGMVLEKQGTIAGFIIGGSGITMVNRRFVRRPGHGLLASIATVEDFRRMGVASAIMVAFVRSLRQAGIRTMLYGGCGPEGNASRNVARSAGAVIEVRHFNMHRAL